MKLRHHQYGNKIDEDYFLKDYSIREKVRTSYQYKQWTETMRKTKGKKCEICGYEDEYEDEKLQVHHIKRFVTIFKEHKEEIKCFNDAMDCEELWDENNVLVLCKTCHKQQHKKTNDGKINKNTNHKQWW